MKKTTAGVPGAPGGRVAKNTAILFASKVASKPLSLVYIFIVARALGVESFGKYSFILTFAGFFGVLADFGLKTPLQRAVARDRQRTSLYVANALLIKTGITIAAVAVFHAAASIFGYFSTYGILLYAGLAIVVLDSLTETLFHVFRAHEIFKYEALVCVARAGLLLLLTVIVVRLWEGLLPILLVMLVSIGLGVAFVVLVYLKRFTSGGFTYDGRIARDFLRMSLVFGFGSGLYTLYNKIDILMLERMVGQRSVGVYAAAYTLLENMEVVSMVFTAAFMPFLFRVLAVSREEAIGACRRSLGYLLAVGMPAAVILTLLSREVIGLLYGAQYAASGPALAILVWAAPLRYAFAVLATLLIAHDREGTGLVVGALGVPANVLMNLALIPLYAHAGAAAATVATEILMLILQVVFMMKYVGNVPVPEGLARLTFANLLLGLLLWAIRPLGLFPALAIALGAYLLLLRLTGFLTRERWEFVLHLIDRQEKQGQ